MKLTPEVASLLGAFIGASAAIIPALITNKATRTLDRDNRRWERRIDSVEETYRAYTALAVTRRTTMSRREPPPDQHDAWPLRDDAEVATVKLELYGSLDAALAVKTAHNAWLKWYVAILNWRVHERAAPQWLEVGRCSKKADEADAVLFEALYREAALRSRRRLRLTFWHRRSQ